MNAGWIEASKQLPDSDLMVLVHCPTDSEPVWLGFHDGTFWLTAEGDYLNEGFVAHWMNLPEPPE